MATVGERLATIEASIREVRDDVKQLRDSIEGGGGVEWKRSVKGEIHELKSVLRSITLRRSYGVGLLKGWVQVVLALVAVGTLAAAWYGALHH